MPSIEFTRVTHADLPMLRNWLQRPHMREWWGDPDGELEIIIDMIEGRETTEPYIFHIDGKPTGYIQVWHLRPQLDEPEMIREYPWLLELPQDTVGVDLSIGDEENLSRGLGTQVLRSFVEMLRARNHHTIIIDPDPKNTRAIRAYENAGFARIPALEDKYENVLLMQHQESK